MSLSFSSLWAVVGFGTVTGLTGGGHCFLPTVSDYVPTCIGRSTSFSLKLFRLN